MDKRNTDSVEMRAVGDSNSGQKRGNIYDPNHIHFVAVGRVKDHRILISAITNRQF